jgi:hypothetical protein
VSAATAAWLAAREPVPPAALAAALERAVEPFAGVAPLAAALAEAGVRALREAIALGDDRAAAYALLTADALFTYAVEAAAEQGMESVSAVLETWGPASLGRVVEPDPV